MLAVPDADWVGSEFEHRVPRSVWCSTGTAHEPLSSPGLYYLVHCAYIYTDITKRGKIHSPPNAIPNLAQTTQYACRPTQLRRTLGEMAIPVSMPCHGSQPPLIFIHRDPFPLFFPTYCTDHGTCPVGAWEIMNVYGHHVCKAMSPPNRNRLQSM